MSAVVVTSFLFIFLSTAEFIYAKSSTSLSASTPVTLVGEQVTVPTAEITSEAGESTLHRYAVHVPHSDDGKGTDTEIRFLLYRKPDGNIVSVADACTICGPVGFYMGSQGITCKMCASPLVPASMGQPGGCNPIPLHATASNGQITIAAQDLRALIPRFER